MTKFILSATNEARDLARRLGAQIEDVPATGGVTTAADVRAYAAQRSKLPGSGVRADTDSWSSALPAFTASGVDPKVLMRYPAPVRAAMAAAPTIPEAYALGEKYQGMSDATARDSLAADPTVDVAHGGCRGSWPS